jgi:putative ABC transport system permease protein
MLGESLLLSALGGAAGILLAYWAISGMVVLAPSDIHRLDDLRIDVPVLIFTAVIAMLTGLLFGLAPSIFAARQDPNDALRRGGRWGEGGVSARIRRVLVVAEVALSLVLLAGAGLLIRSLRAVMQLSPGFESSHLLTMQIDLRRDRYPGPEQGGAFASQLLERVQHLPGVRSAAVINSLPMQSIQMAGFLVEGQSEPAPGQALVADVRAASHEYFATMGMRIIAGRGFTQAETEKQSATETIVNESLARKLWPGGNALGQMLRSPGNFSGEAWRRVVVGVVTDTRQLGLDNPPRPEMFVPMRRIYPNFTLVVRTAADPLRAASTVTAQVWAIDKGQPVHDVLSMEQVVNDTISQRRFNMLVLAIFAGTALARAAVGIYGVLAYSVNRRTQEIGISHGAGGADPGCAGPDRPGRFQAGDERYRDRPGGRTGYDPVDEQPPVRSESHGCGHVRSHARTAGGSGAGGLLAAGASRRAGRTNGGVKARVAVTAAFGRPGPADAASGLYLPSGQV